MMLKYLWGGGIYKYICVKPPLSIILYSIAAAGACTGYIYGLAKHLPVHPYIATYTMSFGLSSMLFAGILHMQSV